QAARTLDPLSPRLMATYAIYLGVMGQDNRSLTLLRNVTEQYPDYANAYPFLAIESSNAGRHDEAIAAIARARFNENPNFLVWKVVIYARAGRMDEARKILSE